MTVCDDTLQTPVSLTHEQRGDTRVVHFTGDLTRSEALRLHDLLFDLDHQPGPVVLDLGGVCFASASGIGLLVEVYRHLKDTGHHLALANVTPPVRELLQLTRVDTILPMS